MRRGLLRAVSSALLLVLWVPMPHPSCDEAVLALGRAAPGSSGVLLSEFYPCGLADDEYLTLTNRGYSHISLRNWSITDGEGTIRFLVDFILLPGRSLTVSWNSTSYWRAFCRMPDICMDSPGTESNVNITGRFRLSDSGDTLALSSAEASVVDVVMYGSVAVEMDGWSGAPIPSLRKGEVAKRVGSGQALLDTDSASDWQPFREYKYGYTEFLPERFDVPAGAITAFTSPDCSLEVVGSVIDLARTDISICTYEFSSVPISEGLVRALQRGVNVRLLVDGAPAGGMSKGEVTCLSVLRKEGAIVLAINGDLAKGVVQHIAALHAKYLVADYSTSIVMSENFVEDGLPVDRIVGNRGWGAAIRDANVARHLLNLFGSDSRISRNDVTDWRDDPRYDPSSILNRENRESIQDMLLGPIVSTEPAHVTVIVSPDGSIMSPFAADLMKTGGSVLVEQFQCDLFWTSRWTGERGLSPLVLALLDSGSKGCVEKVLLDSSWFNLPRNSLVVESLEGNSTSDSSEFRLLDSRSPVTLLHNKGILINDNITAITSNNWVSASFSRNRELAMIVESVEISSHFRRAFDLDWVPDEVPPVCDAGPDIEIALGKNIVLDASRCADDRTILNYSWDIDADGVVDSSDTRLLFEAEVAGEHVVVLRVTDSWGNSAVDEVRVTVVSPATHGSDEEVSGVSRLLWLVPVAAALGVLMARLFARRGPRNVNHRPRS